MTVKRRGRGKSAPWRARYRDIDKVERQRTFARKLDAERWLAQAVAARDKARAEADAGIDIAAEARAKAEAEAKAQKTVGEWLDTWLAGYGNRAPGTVKMAKAHAAHIRAEFGQRRLTDVQPSDVRAWTARLARDGMAPSYVYALYRRLAQVYADAVLDGVVPRSPCSRRVAPPQGRQRPYVATDAQVWALFDAFPEHLQPAVLLGAFAGLRVSEAAALRVGDVDFMRGVVTVTGKGGKTAAIAIPSDLAAILAAYVQVYRGKTAVTDEFGGPSSSWAIERAMRAARAEVAGLPAGFRFHDLRHYFASALINAGCSVKVVQQQMRHGSAATTLNVYGHLMPDADETARAAIAEAMATRAGNMRAVSGPF